MDENKNATQDTGDVDYMTDAEFQTIIDGVAKDAVQAYRKQNPIRKFFQFTIETLVFLVVGTLGVSALICAGWVFGLALKLLLGK